MKEKKKISPVGVSACPIVSWGRGESPAYLVQHKGGGPFFLVLTAMLAAARRAWVAQRGMTEGGELDRVLGPTNDPGWVHRSG
jgi:hypothetical protein